MTLLLLLSLRGMYQHNNNPIKNEELRFEIYKQQIKAINKTTYGNSTITNKLLNSAHKLGKVGGSLHTGEPQFRQRHSFFFVFNYNTQTQRGQTPIGTHTIILSCSNKLVRDCCLSPVSVSESTHMSCLVPLSSPLYRLAGVT